MHVEWKIVTGNPQVTRKLKEFAKMCSACNTSSDLGDSSHVTCIYTRLNSDLRWLPNAVVTCERTLLFQIYFRGVLQLINIFQHVPCLWNIIIIKWFQNSFGGWNNFISVSHVVTCEIKHGNNIEIISVFYFTCNHCRLHVKKTKNKTLT